LEKLAFGRLVFMEKADSGSGAARKKRGFCGLRPARY
jgi:hypothetical protein